MTTFIIHSDGASKGNPGDAGIGVVITTEDGQVLREVGEYIGKATNNVAEYSALIRGLREAADLGADAVEIATDSELMARQLGGVYKVKSANLKPLYDETINLLRCFSRVRISHVMREFNKRADELANQGVKNQRKAGKRKPPSPPAKRAEATEPIQRDLGL